MGLRGLLVQEPIMGFDVMTNSWEKGLTEWGKEKIDIGKDWDASKMGYSTDSDT